MSNSKKITSAVLIAALSASSLVVAPNIAEAKTFNDVPKSHWAYNVIDEMSDKKIMNGTAKNIFSPNLTLTRSHFATVLYNLAPNKSIGNAVSQFSDVSDNAWYKVPAQWAVSNGIMFKQDSAKFNGDVAMSRESMALSTYKFLKTYYPDALDESEYDANFADADKFSGDYLRKAVNVLAYNGLISGRGNNMFAPKATLTRAESSAMASRIVHFTKNNTPVVPPEKPEDPEKPVDPNPEEPQEPDTPPVEESKPYPGDENAPEWMIKIGVCGENGVVNKYTYVTKPDYYTQDQWENLKAFYKDKERPSNYTQTVSYRDDAQAWMNIKMDALYDDMQRAKAREALEAGTVQLSAEEQKMIDMVNAERRKAGVPELKFSPKLCEAAKIRAKEANIKYSHTRPNGTNQATVLNDVDLVYNKIIGDVNSIACTENLAGNYGAVPKSAEKAMQGLLNSPSHKKNMLHDIHGYIGVAAASNGKECAWIQTFGRIQ